MPLLLFVILLSTYVQHKKGIISFFLVLLPSLIALTPLRLQAILVLTLVHFFVVVVLS